jgi:hypothetical protein
VLTIAQDFAERIGAELEILGQSWARADAIYAEAFARLNRDVAADLRWLKRAACGAIASPGPEALHTLEEGRFGAVDDCADAVQRFAQLDGRFRAIVLRGASPLARYSALGPLIDDRTLAPAAAAERILGKTSDARHVFVVADPHAFDEGSRQVVELLSRGGHGTWLIPGETNALPPSRAFLVAPRLSACGARRRDVESFVDSPAFAAYLAHGEVPRPRRRSRTRRADALFSPPSRSSARAFRASSHRGFSRIFCFTAPDDLVVGGVTTLDDEAIAFRATQFASRPPGSFRPRRAPRTAAWPRCTRAASMPRCSGSMPESRRAPRKCWSRASGLSMHCAASRARC